MRFTIKLLLCAFAWHAECVRTNVVAGQNLVDDYEGAAPIDGCADSTYKIEVQGEGEAAEAGDTLKVSLKSTWTKDTESGDWWNTESDTMVVGTGRMFHGLDVGMLGMKVNEKRNIK